MNARLITGPNWDTTTIRDCKSIACNNFCLSYVLQVKFVRFGYINRMIFENTPSNPIEINLVKFEDLHELCIISRQTFIDAFKDQNKEENISHFVNGAYTVENLGNQLNNSDSEFYFARAVDSLKDKLNPALGYMKINFGSAQSELQDSGALELERIYVDSNQLGKGIGQLLLDKAIEIARKAGLSYIWLGVWEHNLKARRFYAKNGFVKFDEHIFTLGDDDQTDLLLKKIL